MLTSTESIGFMSNLVDEVMWGFGSSYGKIVNKDICGYKVYNDKHSKAEKDKEGLFNVEEHDLEVESLQDGYSTEKETVTEGSGYDEGIVDKDLELKTDYTP